MSTPGPNGQGLVQRVTIAEQLKQLACERPDLSGFLLVRFDGVGIDVRINGLDPPIFALAVKLVDEELGQRIAASRRPALIQAAPGALASRLRGET